MFDLTKSVNRSVRPLVESRGGRMVRAVGGKWGDQLVDFDLGDLRIRVEVERGYVDLLFASVTDPGEWFRAEHVVAFLGGRYHVDATSHEPALEQIGRVLSKLLDPVQQLFSPRQYDATKREMKEFLRWWRPPGSE